LLQYLGYFVPIPPTGASLLDLTGGLGDTPLPGSLAPSPFGKFLDPPL